MRIGIVDLDTSHPANWIPILRELGHEIVGIWDGGAVHPPDYAARFAAERGIDHVFADLHAMADAVDGAILHGCDWDTHIEKARPFVAAGKSLLIDKPLAGNLADLGQMRAWMAEGVRLTGGSSLRFCVEAQEWLARPVAERGTPHTALAGCGVDEFNYGIHAYSLLLAAMGPGVETVQHIAAGPQRRIELRWPDERVALLSIGAASGPLPFHLTLVTEREVATLRPDPTRLYRALLMATLPYLAGETETPPVPPDELLLAERCALAALTSWRNEDRPVALAELRPTDPGYDGAAFALGYRAMRYPNGW